MPRLFSADPLSFEQIDQFDAFGRIQLDPSQRFKDGKGEPDHAPIQGTPGNDIFLVGYDYRTLEIDGGEGEDLIGFEDGTNVYVQLSQSFDLGNHRSGLTSIEGFRGTAQDDVFLVMPFELESWTYDLILEGMGGSDYLRTGAGDDIVRGGDGADRIGVGGGDDFVDGGEGRDELFYHSANTDHITTFFHVDMRTGDVFADGSGGSDTFVNIENITGGSGGDDIVIGDDSDNVFNMLRGGQDRVEGMGGDDLIAVAEVGGYLDGGDGIDQIYLHSEMHVDEDNNRNGVDDLIDVTSGGVINLATGEVTDGFGNTGTILNFENAVGTVLDDTIIGNGQANEISGNRGADVLDGAGGDDLIYGNGADTMTGGSGQDVFYFIDYGFEYSSLGYSLDGLVVTDFADDVLTFYSDFVFQNGDQLAPQMFLQFMGTDPFSGAGTAMELRYEHVDGDTLIHMDMDGNGVAEGSITLTGLHDLYATEGEAQTEMSIYQLEVNTIGTDEDDILIGTFGNDTLNGGRGSDYISGRDGNDSVNGGAQSDFIFGGVGHDRLNGASGNDKLFGGEGSDTFVFGRGSGLDIVDDFEIETDIIQVRNIAGVSSFDDLVLEQSGQDVRIIAGEIEIILRDTPIDALHAGHFSIVAPSNASIEKAPAVYEPQFLEIDAPTQTAVQLPLIETDIDTVTYDYWVIDDWMLG